MLRRNQRAGWGCWVMAEPNPKSRQRVVDVFGDSCPICGHSLTKGHSFWERCNICSRDCGDSVWPPESVERFRRYHHPETERCGRCERLGYIDRDSGWCQECLNGPLPAVGLPEGETQ